MITTNFMDEGTEQRFVEHTRERERKIALIKAKEIVEANPAELVKKRAARLKADPDVLQVINEGMKARRPSEGFSAAEFPRALERVLQTNDLMSIGFFERGLQVARPVARISTSTGNGYFYGTGFLVSPSDVDEPSYIQLGGRSGEKRCGIQLQVCGKGSDAPDFSDCRCLVSSPFGSKTVEPFGGSFSSISARSLRWLASASGRSLI